MQREKAKERRKPQSKKCWIACAASDAWPPIPLLSRPNSSTRSSWTVMIATRGFMEVSKQDKQSSQHKRICCSNLWRRSSLVCFALFVCVCRMPWFQRGFVP